MLIVRPEVVIEISSEQGIDDFSVFVRRSHRTVFYDHVSMYSIARLWRFIQAQREKGLTVYGGHVESLPNTVIRLSNSQVKGD